MNMQAEPAVAGAEALCLTPAAVVPIDIERLTTLAMRMLGGFELIDSLVRAARENEANDRTFLDNVENTADTYGDVACEVLDMLHDHADRVVAD
jgi:hypothetical protein